MIKIATLALAAALMGFAQAPVPRMQQRALKALNLTGAQKQQAKTIFQQARQNAQPLREQLKTNREAMRTAVQSNNSAEIQRLAGLQGNLETQVIANRAQAMAKFYSLLTPDQAAQVNKRQQRGMRWKGKTGE